MLWCPPKKTVAHSLETWGGNQRLSSRDTEGVRVTYASWLSDKLSNTFSSGTPVAIHSSDRQFWYPQATTSDLLRPCVVYHYKFQEYGPRSSLTLATTVHLCAHYERKDSTRTLYLYEYSRTELQHWFCSRATFLYHLQNIFWCYNSTDWDGFLDFLASYQWNDWCFSLDVSTSVTNSTEIVYKGDLFYSTLSRPDKPKSRPAVFISRMRRTTEQPLIWFSISLFKWQSDLSALA